MENQEPKLGDSLLKVQTEDPDCPTWSSDIRVAREPVQVWNDGLFRRLREQHKIPNNFLNGFEDIKRRQLPNDGKGGSPLFLSEDRQYIIKEISGTDHTALLQSTESYVKHTLAGGSVLSPIYLHFEMADASSSSTSGVEHEQRKRYIAMRNLMPENGPWVARYDLKGCADDKTLERQGKRINAVHKRMWYITMWCSSNWTPARWTYYEGKVEARNFHMSMPKAVRDEIVDSINRDCDWLSERGLMDYSLLLGIRRFPIRQYEQLALGNGRTVGGHGAVKEFSWKTQDEAFVLTVGIIDFLQPWTLSKKIAMYIKVFECNKATIPPDKYAARFKRHFAERFRTQRE